MPMSLSLCLEPVPMSLCLWLCLWLRQYTKRTGAVRTTPVLVAMLLKADATTAAGP